MKECYSEIVPDMDVVQFCSEYRTAAQCLAEYRNECNGQHEALKMLTNTNPNQFTVLKTALARIVAAKPHSAEVERFISKYFLAFVP